MWLRALAIVMTLLLAGCVGDAERRDDEETPAPAPVLVPEEPDYDFSQVVDPDHGGHSVPDLHTAGHGLTLAGFTEVQGILPQSVRGSITQIDVHDDWAVVAGMEGGLAFVLLDVSDPKAPKPVSWYPSSADGWTARFSEDGNVVFYGCQRLETYNPHALTRGTCEDPEALAPGQGQPSGVIAVDVSDKTDPKFIDFLPTRGSHNLVTAYINGSDYIFTNAVDIVRYDAESRTMEVVADLPGQHDSAVAQHPITGDWLLYTGTGQLTIYDINDPADPTIVYEGTGEEGWTGWHEQTVVPGVVDGRVILILAGESFVSTGAVETDEAASGLPDIISIVDITDPAAPQLLGVWSPPYDPQVPWASYLYSVHEIAATPTGQVAIAWYHAGVWVIDVSTVDRQARPVTLAAYQPNKEMSAVPATFAQTPLPYVPFVWGAGWSDDGYLLVPDMHTGLYVLEPEWGLHPAIDGGQ